MGDGKWTPGKIFLLVIGILFGLGILCCGGGLLLFGDKLKAAFSIATDSKEFVDRLHAEFGKSAVFDIVKNDQNELVLAIGTEGELTPERVTEAQDKSWRAFCDAFGKDGFVPVRWVAIGHALTAPDPGEPAHGGGVVDWGKNLVSVDELVRRTGLPAPPVSKALPAGVDVRMHGGRSDGDAEKDRDAEKEEDDGSGGK